jgi:hypothetical protein
VDGVIRWTEPFGGRSYPVDGAIRWTELSGGRSYPVDGAIRWTEPSGGRSYLVDGAIWWTELSGGRSHPVDGAIRWTELSGGRSYPVDGAIRPSYNLFNAKTKLNPNDLSMQPLLVTLRRGLVHYSISPTLFVVMESSRQSNRMRIYALRGGG